MNNGTLTSVFCCFSYCVLDNVFLTFSHNDPFCTRKDESIASKMARVRPVIPPVGLIILENPWESAIADDSLRLLSIPSESAPSVTGHDVIWKRIFPDGVKTEEITMNMSIRICGVTIILRSVARWNERQTISVRRSDGIEGESIIISADNANATMDTQLFFAPFSASGIRTSSGMVIFPEIHAVSMDAGREMTSIRGSIMNTPLPA